MSDKLREPLKEIFLQRDGDGQVGGLYEGTTWCQDQINEDDIRYVLAEHATADTPPEPTDEMVTKGLEAAKRWGFRVISPRPDSSATSIFECGEHPRTFIEDVVRAALAVQQKGEG